jgi:hypothetical protein
VFWLLASIVALNRFRQRNCHKPAALLDPAMHGLRVRRRCELDLTRRSGRHLGFERGGGRGLATGTNLSRSAIISQRFIVIVIVIVIVIRSYAEHPANPAK